MRLEVTAVHVAHCDVQDTVFLVGVVDGNNVRMVERSGEPRLAHEPRPEVLVICDLGNQHLQRGLAVQALMCGEVDRAHTASTEDPLDPVAGKVVAYLESELDPCHEPFRTLARRDDDFKITPRGP